MEYDKGLHSKLLICGKNIEKSTCHSLEKPFVETILGTLSYYGCTKNQLGLVAFDLSTAKYKIWDWLGMAYTGRLDDPNDEIASKQAHTTIEKMIKLYIYQKDVGGFAWWLRGHDLDVEEPSRCEDCIKSYDHWHNQTEDERLKDFNDMQKFYGDPI